jgi:hypothetical protein
MDTKLIWREYITKTRKQMDFRYKELYWLLGRSSPLSINNKLLYKTVIAPIWTYGLELWGCASKSNIAIFQRFQSKLLRANVNAPWYITNAMIHSDLGITTVQYVIHKKSNKHRANLQPHSNPLLQSLSSDNIPRILKRRWPTDL